MPLTAASTTSSSMNATFKFLGVRHHVVVGHNQQLLVILPHDDAGAAAGHLVSLRAAASEKPGVGIITLILHQAGDRHHRGHSLLHDGGHVHPAGVVGASAVAIKFPAGGWIFSRFPLSWPGVWVSWAFCSSVLAVPSGADTVWGRKLAAAIFTPTMVAPDTPPNRIAPAIRPATL